MLLKSATIQQLTLLIDADAADSIVHQVPIQHCTLGLSSAVGLRAHSEFAAYGAAPTLPTAGLHSRMISFCG